MEAACHPPPGIGNQLIEGILRGYITAGGAHVRLWDYAIPLSQRGCVGDREEQ